MSSKINPEQIQSDEISSSLLENKKFKHLDNLSVNNLLKIYLQEVSDVNDLKEIVEDYGLEYDEESGKLKSNAKIKDYVQKMVDLKDILIAEIQLNRRLRKKALSEVSNIKLKELSEVDKLRLENQELKRQNQMLINYIQSISAKLIPQKQQEIKSLIESKQATLEHNKPLIVEGIKNNVPEILPIPPVPTHPFTSAPIIKNDSPTKIQDVNLKQLSENNKLKLRVQELERENQILKDYIQNIRSKQIVEGIPKRIPKHPAIDEIKEALSNIPALPKEIIKSTAYGESKQFKLEHCNMTFKEWSKLVGNSSNDKQMDLVRKTIESIRKDPFNWKIYLYKFNAYGREQLVEPLVDVLENVVAPLLSADQKMMLHYYIGEVIYSDNVNKTLINNSWRSKPLSYDSFNDLI